MASPPPSSPTFFPTSLTSFTTSSPPPRTPSSPDGSPDDPLDPHSASRPFREPPAVLVVDDAAVVRLAITRRLVAAGIPFVEAASVDDAVSVGTNAADGAIIAALLDLDLGDRDRDGTYVALKIREAHPRLPIAFFSGEIEADRLALARALGPLFAKPHDMNAALAWIIRAATVTREDR